MIKGIVKTGNKIKQVLILQPHEHNFAALLKNHISLETGQAARLTGIYYGNGKDKDGKKNNGGKIPGRRSG